MHGGTFEVNSTNGLTGWQQFLLVLFRFSIGWHLFYQGLGKLQAVRWTSEGYLLAATGPLAPLFQRMASHPILLRIGDVATMWGLVVLGTLIMVGLFTRTASALAIGLLLLFYLAQPPLPVYGFAVWTRDGSELYVNKVFLEVMALLVCTAFNTGQISGLDMLLGVWHRKSPASDSTSARVSAPARN